MDHVDITVPGVPEGLHPADCWRRTVSGVDADADGGYAVTGSWLHADDVVAVAAGTVIIVVDKVTLRWEYAYRSSHRYRRQDATVSVHLATVEGLTELWRRHYKHSKNAVGSTTRTKLAALLTKYPVPDDDTVQLVHEAQRPNARAQTCRWCGHMVSKGCGHVVGHGPDAEVEHDQDCLPRYITGDEEGPCARCGKTVLRTQAQAWLIRDGSGRWELRHRPQDGQDCLTVPIPTRESQLAYQQWRREQQEAAAAATSAAEDRRRQQREVRAAKREQQRAADAAAAQGLIEAHGITATLASSIEFDKNLGCGRRAELTEQQVRLGDGTTLTRWTVSVYVGGAAAAGWNGEDYDPPTPDTEIFYRKDSARAAYQRLRYQDSPQQPRTRGGRQCDECGGGGAYHHRRDSSGIPGIVCDRCDRSSCHDDGGPADYLLSFA